MQIFTEQSKKDILKSFQYERVLVYIKYFFILFMKSDY